MALFLRIRLPPTDQSSIILANHVRRIPRAVRCFKLGKRFGRFFTSYVETACPQFIQIETSNDPGRIPTYQRDSRHGSEIQRVCRSANHAAPRSPQDPARDQGALASLDGRAQDAPWLGVIPDSSALLRRTALRVSQPNGSMPLRAPGTTPLPLFPHRAANKADQQVSAGVRHGPRRKQWRSMNPNVVG